MANRQCEDCGYRMPRHVPRMRRATDGKLVCNGCHPDGRGHPSMPVGMHGSLVVEGPFVSSRVRFDEGLRGRTALNYSCPWCASNPSNPDVQQLDSPNAPLVSCKCMTYCGVGWCMAATHSLKLTTATNQTLIVEAHDGGEGAVIYHCPFCGGGNVVRNSDNSTECGYCNATFTVQMQPTFPNTPQTINGQPIDMPGMPGGVGAPGDAAPPGDQQQAPATPNAFQPPDAPAAAFEPPDQAPPKEAPKVAAKMYLTDRGVLAEDAYIRHLALRFADDPQLTLQQVRTARKESSR